MGFKFYLIVLSTIFSLHNAIRLREGLKKDVRNLHIKKRNKVSTQLSFPSDTPTLFHCNTHMYCKEEVYTCQL